jgi:hypothetical protein
VLPVAHLPTVLRHAQVAPAARRIAAWPPVRLQTARQAALAVVRDGC